MVKGRFRVQERTIGGAGGHTINSASHDDILHSSLEQSNSNINRSIRAQQNFASAANDGGVINSIQ